VGSRSDPRLTRHIDNAFPLFDGLLAAAEAVQALGETAGWPVLLTLIDEEVSTIEARLEGGVLDSKAEYAYLHGRIGGLRAAPALLMALTTRAENRLDEQRRKHEAGETAVGV
jgi:hypothetical protein